MKSITELDCVLDPVNTTICRQTKINYFYGTNQDSSFLGMNSFDSSLENIVSFIY